MPVPANRFRRLQVVIDLREVRIGIAVVNQRVQVLHCLPNTHRALLLGEILPFLSSDELYGLQGMVEAVKLAHAGRTRVVMLTELFFLPVRIVTFLYEIVPLLKALNWSHNRQNTLSIRPAAEIRT